MSPVDIANRKQVFTNLLLNIFLLVLVLILVPLYFVSVIKIVDLTGVFSASKGALTLFIIYFVLQFPIYLYNFYVLRKRNKELTSTQVDKIKIFSTIVATVIALLLNYNQWLPVLYFAVYLLASNRILTYLDVRFNFSKMQNDIAGYVIDFLFILIGLVNPLIKSGIIPLLVFIILLKATTNVMRLVFKFTGKRSEQIINEVTSQLPGNNE